MRGSFGHATNGARHSRQKQLPGLRDGAEQRLDVAVRGHGQPFAARLYVAESEDVRRAMQADRDTR